ncbi:MAG TPA: alanine racemase [Solirubrobacterales bacterium]|nr:alanine racemase [Solirubrobacterales bacterium]
MERATARIDQAAISANCARLKAELGESELCAVVKADGYGHGAETSARAALAGGATRLAVATAAEAAELGPLFPQAPLLTMGALTAEEVEVALGAGAELALWREEFRPLVADRARALGRPARVHVKYDSGMGRLGIREPDQVLALVRACAEDPDLELAGLWTHFATADELDSEYFDEQLSRFGALAATVKEQHPGVLVHAANSAAVLRDRRSHFEMARCGVAIYGLDPFQRDPAEHGLRPALTLRSHVADVKRFQAGASAGYGRRWKAPADTWVGVVPVGYGDGVRRALTNNADILVGGRRRPLVGTVSMDNITIDLGPETEVRPGDEAVLVGAQGKERILAEEVAHRLETINYEVTCAISPRVPRRPA